MGLDIGRGLVLIPLKIAFDDCGHDTRQYGLHPIRVKQHISRNADPRKRQEIRGILSSSSPTAPARTLITT
jgi:hypothetical protein